MPSPETLNSTIELIHKLNVAIKQISITPFMQNSLITSLNLYSDHLKKNLNNQSQSNKIPETNTILKNSLENVNQNMRNNKSFQNPRGLMTEQSKIEKINTGKITEKQNNRAIPLKLKQNHTKVILPQITKGKPKNPPLPSLTQDEPQKQKDETIKPQEENNFIHPTIEMKSLNKTPKSRFFELKNSYHSEQYDQCLQNEEKSNIVPKTEQKKSNSLSKDKKETRKYDQILEGLKKRWAQHIKLIEKLQGKIEEFQTKKLGRKSQKVYKDKVQDEQCKQNLIQSQFGNKNAEENSNQVQILKGQLLQRQQQLKNLWTVLLQQQSFGTPCSQ